MATKLNVSNSLCMDLGSQPSVWTLEPKRYWLSTNAKHSGAFEVSVTLGYLKVYS